MAKIELIALPTADINRAHLLLLHTDDQGRQYVFEAMPSDDNPLSVASGSSHINAYNWSEIDDKRSDLMKNGVRVD